MRMQVFSAPRLHQALSKVRETFGSEAIILDKQQDVEANGEKTWHVRAALDTPGLTAKTKPAPKTGDTDISHRLQTSMQQLERLVHGLGQHESATLRETLPGEADRQIFDMMITHGVAAAYAADIAPSIANHQRAESACLRWGQQLDPKTAREVVLISGPGGAGKTTMIANLATHFSLKGVEVALISTDTERMAGVDSLAAYAAVLGIALHPLRHIREADNILQQTKTARLLLIDSEGWTQSSQRAYLRQAPLWQALSPNRHMLLLPANLDEADGMALLEKAVEHNVTDLLPSKLDETSRIGKVVNWAVSARLPLSYCSFGSSVPDQMGRLSATTLATLLGRKQIKEAA